MLMVLDTIYDAEMNAWTRFANVWFQIEHIQVIFTHNFNMFKWVQI